MASRNPITTTRTLQVQSNPSKNTTPEGVDREFATQGITAAMKHPTPRDEHIEWRCAGHPEPEVFQPTDPDTLAEAKAVCSGCPARLVCLNLGLDRKEWGVWGGVLLEGGKRLAEPRKAGRPKKQPQRDAATTTEDAVALG